MGDETRNEKRNETRNETADVSGVNLDVDEVRGKHTETGALVWDPIRDPSTNAESGLVAERSRSAIPSRRFFGWRAGPILLVILAAGGVGGIAALVGSGGDGARNRNSASALESDGDVTPEASDQLAEHEMETVSNETAPPPEESTTTTRLPHSFSRFPSTSVGGGQGQEIRSMGEDYLSPAADPRTSWIYSEESQVEFEAFALRIADLEAYMGVEMDHDRQVVLVIYDPNAQGGDLIETAVANYSGGLEFELKRSQVSMERLKEIQSYIETHQDNPIFRSEPAMSYIDPAMGKVVIITPADGLVAREMVKLFGDLVVIKDGVMQRLSGPRVGDVSPHWGGALAVNFFEGTSCTNGFTVHNIYGFRGGLTAAHCGIIPGDEFYTAWSADSAYYLGEGWGNGNFPTQDFEWIFDWGIQHTNVIHTGPSAPTTRNVIGRGNPTLGMTVCVSGAATGANCNAVVTSLDASNCDVYGCTPNLAYAIATPWKPVSGPGDSGGPVYTKSGSSNAIARGIVIAGTYGNDVAFQKVSTIEAAHLTIVTTP